MIDAAGLAAAADVRTPPARVNEVAALHACWLLCATFAVAACDGNALVAIERAPRDSGAAEARSPVTSRDAALLDAPMRDALEVRDGAAPPPDECSATVPDMPAALPPMGWSGSRTYQCSPELNEAKLVDIVRALASTGMQAAGYRYVAIGDCWQAARAADGPLVTIPARLPSGVGVLAGLLHDRGLKLSVASSRGERSCGSGAGSLGREVTDARAFAAWGADMVTYNDCAGAALDRRTHYETMTAALRSQSRGNAIVFAIAAPAFEEWMPSVGQLWRTTASVEPTWASIVNAINVTTVLAPYAHYGAWNDPDVLLVGAGPLTESELRAQFTLWSMFNAPLFAGNDVAAMSESTRALLTNTDVIALNQDALGLQAARLSSAGVVQRYAKPLSRCGARAIALFNPDVKRATVTVDWQDVGLTRAPASWRNLWTQERGAALGNEPYLATVVVEPHDVVVLEIVGAEPPVPRGDVEVSDLPFTYAANYHGPVERDLSNGEHEPRDGTTMKLRGRSYAKGLGVHGPSLVRLRLGGGCTRFSADVGIDDETAGRGSAHFEVWGDGKLRYATPVLHGTSRVVSLDVDVTGVRDLRLFVSNGFDDTTFDHANWGDARLRCLP